MLIAGIRSVGFNIQVYSIKCFWSQLIRSRQLSGKEQTHFIDKNYHSNCDYGRINYYTASAN